MSSPMPSQTVAQPVTPAAPAAMPPQPSVPPSLETQAQTPPPPQPAPIDPGVMEREINQAVVAAGIKAPSDLGSTAPVTIEALELRVAILEAKFATVLSRYYRSEVWEA